jgi:hypothetical protein
MRALSILVVVCVLSASQANAQEPEFDPEYVRVTNERADRIVATLGIEDAADSLRIRDLVAGWYRTLSRIHDLHDAGTLSFDKVAEQQLTAHRRFFALLEAQLTHEQVELIKDGLTYGVVPLTYRGYLELLPDLTDEQQVEVMANLLEAREYAIDAGSSDEKHAWFGKYKGRINNYLSDAGYDLRQAERDRAAREESDDDE